MHPWFILFGSIMAEVAGTTSMKLSEGFTKPGYAVLIVVCYLISFALLTVALKHIELSLAYAVWAGVGTATVALIGIAVFNETMTAMKLVSLALIVAGVAGLNLSGSGH